MATDRALDVVVVDDQRAFAESIAIVIDAEPDLRCVDTLLSGEDAVRRCTDEPPDVVVMDVDMPGIGGIEATRQILQHHPDVDVVIVTGAADPATLSLAAGAGAKAFVLKDAPVAHVIDAVRSADSRRSMSVDASAMDRFLDRVPDVARLTPRELEVLGMLAEGRQPKEIAAELGITVHTCRGYVKNILSALGVHSALEAVVEGHRRGLLRIDGPR